MFNKLIKYLASLRFTIVLICLLGVIFALGLLIPQKSLVRDIYFEWQKNSPALVAFLDALQLTEIYTSWLTLSLWGLFFLNLALVIWQRMPLVRKRTEMPESRIVAPETATGYIFQGSYTLPADMDGPAVIALLAKRGYTVLGDERGFFGVKNRYSPLAFAFFHLSFFLILLGGAISFYTTFIGYVDLAQGETFMGELERYNQAPTPAMPKVGGIPKVAFTVTSITPQVVRNTPTGISVKLIDAQGATHDVGINTPYKTDNTFFVFKHLGMSPLFVLVDASGRDVEGAYCKLDVLQGRQDRFRLAGFDFTARFYPDYFSEKGVPATRTQEFKNPTFSIVIERDGKKIGEGVVPKNGALEFAGFRLEMREMPFWVRFYVIKERGVSILYTGFAIACIAVIWRLLFYRREIVGAVRDEAGERRLVVAAKSEFYKSLAEDEFAKMFGEIVGQNNGDTQ
jgi:cytochrome c biogenesis protein ResB